MSRKYGNELAARSDAEAVQQRMRSPERWEIRTWENMGWHWQIHCANVMVTEYSSEEDAERVYYAHVSDDPTCAGPALAAWTPDHRSFDDPQEAVDEAVKEVYRYVDKMIACRQAADNAVDKWWTVVQQCDKDDAKFVHVLHVEAPTYRDAIGLAAQRHGGTSVTIFDGKLRDACHEAREADQAKEERRQQLLRDRRVQAREARKALLGGCAPNSYPEQPAETD